MDLQSKVEASPSQDLAPLRLPENENSYPTIRRAFGSSSGVSVQNSSWLSKMFPTEYIGNSFLEMVTSSEDARQDSKLEIGVRTPGATLVMNSSVNATEATMVPEMFYRHSAAMTVVYCVAYILVFAVGLVGNCFVIAVVFRSPRMRTVTNFFIVNLAVADILVIVFCLPATLTSNIFVRKYFFNCLDIMMIL